MFQTVRKPALMGITLALFSGVLLFAAERKAVIKVHGMSCQSCANGGAGSLKSLKGIKTAEVSVESEQATVVYEARQVSLEEIKNRIEMNGFSTAPQEKK